MTVVLLQKGLETLPQHIQQGDDVKPLWNKREVKEKFHTWEVIECFKADHALEGKASLLCLIHCPSPVVKSPPVKETKLQLTSHPLYPPAHVPSGAARHLKLAPSTAYFCGVTLGQWRFWVWLHWAIYRNSLAQKGDHGVRDTSVSAKKTIRNRFCIDSRPINFGFMFPFRLFRSFLLYWCFL